MTADNDLPSWVANLKHSLQIVEGEERTFYKRTDMCNTTVIYSWNPLICRKMSVKQSMRDYVKSWLTDQGIQFSRINPGTKQSPVFEIYLK